MTRIESVQESKTISITTGADINITANGATVTIDVPDWVTKGIFKYTFTASRDD